MRFPTDNLRSVPALIRFLLTMVVGLTLDQWAKIVAFRELPGLPNGYAFWPGWLVFQATQNRGAVFGFLQGQRWMFIIVSILAIVFIGYLFLISGRQVLTQIVLGMLLAGVLGNMWDRLEFGYVRDMIYALPGRKIMGYDVFPWIFNIADSLLCVGIGLLILQGLVAPPAPSGGRGMEIKQDVAARG